MFQSLDSRSPLNKTPSQQLESIRYFRRDQDKRKRVPFRSSETAGDLPLPASRPLTALIFPAGRSFSAHPPSLHRAWHFLPLRHYPHAGLFTSFRLAQKSPAQREFLGHFADVCPTPPLQLQPTHITLPGTIFLPSTYHSRHFTRICSWPAISFRINVPSCPPPPPAFSSVVSIASRCTRRGFHPAACEQQLLVTIFLSGRSFSLSAKTNPCFLKFIARR